MIRLLWSLLRFWFPRYTRTGTVVVIPPQATSAQRAVRRAEFRVDGWGEFDACWLADTLTGASA